MIAIVTDHIYLTQVTCKLSQSTNAEFMASQNHKLQF